MQEYEFIRVAMLVCRLRMYTCFNNMLITVLILFLFSFPSTLRVTKQ